MEVSQLWVPKNLDEELRLHKLGAAQDALEVVEVFVVLDSALHEARDRACAGERLLREHVVGHDVIGHLQRGRFISSRRICSGPFSSLRTSSRKDVRFEDVGDSLVHALARKGVATA